MIPEVSLLPIIGSKNNLAFFKFMALNIVGPSITPSTPSQLWGGSLGLVSKNSNHAAYDEDHMTISHPMKNDQTANQRLPAQATLLFPSTQLGVKFKVQTNFISHYDFPSRF